MIRFLYISAFVVAAATLAAQSANPGIPTILQQNSRALGLSPADSLEYTVTDNYTTERLGITHVYLEQRYQDIRVYNGILNLNLIGDRLLSFGNRWLPDIANNTPSHIPAITAESAVQRAAAHLGRDFADAVEIRSELNTPGQRTKVVFAPGELSLEEISAELMWLTDDRKDVLLCWMVEVHETDAENVWHIFIDAHTGEFIRKDNLVMHCAFDKPEDTFEAHSSCNSIVASSQAFMALVADSSYNVFAMPVESPNHGSRSIVTTPWHDAGPGNEAATLGWHDNGTTNYTITRGNNVHAYEDIDHNNVAGFSPDTVNLRFDYPFDPELDPADNMAAAITNLFYWNNIMHDVMYQYGFDEVSGNFQVDNLGRGGNDGDDVRAEALDGGGTNNANFFTPSDGNRPRMQMYLWSAVSEISPMTVNSPPSIAGSVAAVESGFSNNNRLEDIGLTTGDLVLVEDMDTTTHEACGAIANADSLVGRIAVIDRGNCDFVVKVKAVQDLGAIAAIVVNNVSGSPFGMGGTDNTIVIPAVMISLSDGNILKAVMDTAVVNVSLDSVPGIIPDGDYDSGIIAHEYGHGISTRLTGGPSNVSCLNNAEQMGEGWSDYFGLMLTTDWTTAAATDRRGIGTYVLGQPTDGDGIRTYPYTVDTTENPFTYADIASSPSVHFIGSVWCTILWDMTWGIIDIAGTDPDMYGGTGGNKIALQLVIDALKLQPCSPGFVDGRDAILLADKIRYGGQYTCVIWEAFARRGLGIDASQGSSNDNEDGVESFSIPNGVFIESTPNVPAAGEGQEVTFTLKTTCGCEGKSDLEITDVLSDDLVYVPGSGGMLNGNMVEFNADTLSPLDSLVFTYHACVPPCSASEVLLLSEDDAEGPPDQYISIKLAGNGTKTWVKSTAQDVSPTHSWYAKNYTTYSSYALTLISSVMTNGPVEIGFDHRYETEANYDGGVVEYSLDTGATWIDAGPYFIENGYPATINTSGTNSLIAGQDAFTGDSDAQFSTTGFIHSTVHLNIGGSQSLLLRFRFVTDGGVGGPGINGWYIDDIFINQLSGVTNQTRVTAQGVLVDSLFYGVQTTPFNGDVLYVDPTATGNQSGTLWSDAMNDLLLALEVAGCGAADSVFVAEGAYLPNINNDRALSFHIPDSTMVFGGFPLGGITFALRDPENFVTLFSGDIGVIDDNSDNVYHVLKIDSAQLGIVLDGVTLSRGNADGVGDDKMGPAVFCEGEASLQNVIATLNSGIADMPIILNRGTNAYLNLRDCTITMPPNRKVLQIISGQVTTQGNTIFVKE